MIELTVLLELGGWWWRFRSILFLLEWLGLDPFFVPWRQRKREGKGEEKEKKERTTATTTRRRGTMKTKSARSISIITATTPRTRRRGTKNARSITSTSIIPVPTPPTRSERKTVITNTSIILVLRPTRRGMMNVRSTTSTRIIPVLRSMRRGRRNARSTASTSIIPARTLEGFYSRGRRRWIFGNWSSCSSNASATVRVRLAFLQIFCKTR
ncbi:hypothetical protein M413DRAFT_250490 [Hebeloma cylindrosporum]|uniref:Uncharacterized protein n=1 Tax=Hebeloma cylindrosporum TaxID=76867 RepID=A0A0C3C383_HEBCY|nr:hypothetical protein M413DRAFT_250490 [Hebeloma cylindrosporum h7]